MSKIIEISNGMSKVSKVSDIMSKIRRMSDVRSKMFYPSQSLFFLYRDLYTQNNSPLKSIRACLNTLDIIDILTASCLLVKAVYCTIRLPKSILLVKIFPGVEILKSSGIV